MRARIGPPPFPTGAPPIDNADILRVPAGPGALHVERYGQGGRPVILLHGFPTSSFLWREVAVLLTFAGFSAFAVDLLGYGESDRPFDADYGIGAQAGYLDHALTALRIATATVVGVDVGGAVALGLAARRPERVERLVLVNSLGFDTEPGEDVRTLQRRTPTVALRWRSTVLGATPLLTPLLGGSVADPGRMPPRLVARYLAPFAGRDGVMHLLALARAIRAGELASHEPADVTAPTLLLRGEHDRWLDARVTEKLAAELPHARAETIPGVARLVPEEAPEHLAERIVSFAGEGLRDGTASPVGV